MADVTIWSNRPDRPDSRGQLILVAGIVVAIALVALVLLLNTVLFAENVATRGVDPAIDRATDHYELSLGMSQAILRNQEGIEYESWDAANMSSREEIREADTHVGNRRFARHGGQASMVVTETRQGAVIRQDDESRRLTADDGDANWRLANTHGVRNFSMTINHNDTGSATGGKRFHLRVTGGSNQTWLAYVNTSNSAIMLEISSENNVCSVDDAETINWTAGTFGDSCTFTFADGLTSPYNIRYRNGDNASGSYHLTVSRDEPNENLIINDLGDPGSQTNPRYAHAVYSMVVQTGYAESGVEYDTAIRVAPGEPAHMKPT